MMNMNSVPEAYDGLRAMVNAVIDQRDQARNELREVKQASKALGLMYQASTESLQRCVAEIDSELQECHGRLLAYQDDYRLVVQALTQLEEDVAALLHDLNCVTIEGARHHVAALQRRVYGSLRVSATPGLDTCGCIVCRRQNG